MALHVLICSYQCVTRTFFNSNMEIIPTFSYMFVNTCHHQTSGLCRHIWGKVVSAEGCPNLQFIQSARPPLSAESAWVAVPPVWTKHSLRYVVGLILNEKKLYLKKLLELIFNHIHDCEHITVCMTKDCKSARKQNLICAENILIWTPLPFGNSRTNMNSE